MSAQLATMPLLLTDGFVPCSAVEANRLLVEWGHRMGPCHRPFGVESWLFLVDGAPFGLAMSASTVSATVAGYRRQEVVELARLCSPVSWVNRLMLRWWREVGALRWEHWPVRAAVSYHHEAHHSGALYRFDGWTKVKEGCGSSGGGTWSTARADDDALNGPKTLWVWRYDPQQPTAQGMQAPGGGEGLPNQAQSEGTP